jgi:hypothetical protein
VRNIPEHLLPRILPSSGFSEIRFCGLMANEGFLREGGCALPLREGYAIQGTVSGFLCQAGAGGLIGNGRSVRNDERRFSLTEPCFVLDDLRHHGR